MDLELQPDEAGQNGGGASLCSDRRHFVALFFGPDDREAGDVSWCLGLVDRAFEVGGWMKSLTGRGEALGEVS